jgi:carbamoyl-phosphate synthase large subunit
MTGSVINTLVTGVSGDVGQGVCKALSESDLEIKIFKTCIHKNSSWLHKDKNKNTFISPRFTSSSYIDFLINLVIKNNIDAIFPCVDGEIYKISKYKDYIEKKTGVKICAGDPEIIEICNDKYETAQFLKKNNFCFPQTIIPSNIDNIIEIVDIVGFPIIAKKRICKGSKGIAIINSLEEAKEYVGRNDYILQELMSNKDGEYTCGIYLGNDNKVKGSCILRRTLVGGSTHTATRVINKDWDRQLERIALSLGLKYVNIQAMVRNNHLYPFEFNGRFSGTTGALRRIFNAPEMYIKENVLGENLSRKDSDEIFHFMRYYEEVYFNEKDICDLEKRSRGY